MSGTRFVYVTYIRASAEKIFDALTKPEFTREYWAAQAKRRIGEIVSSHTVKYPYSFYALAKDVKDEDLKKRILAKVYRLTATN